MIDARLDPTRDTIALESVESYMRKKGVTPSSYPMEAVTQETVFKNELYSRIAERMPNYAVYIMGADYDNDTRAQGLFKALTQHALHPEFISILLQSLDQRHDPDAPKARAAVGALLVDIVTRYCEEQCKPKVVMLEEDDKKKGKKKDEAAEPAADVIDAKVAEKVEPARRAARLLLQNLADEVKNVCAGLEEYEALLIAGCIATGGPCAIKKIIAMDCPVTADVFNIVRRDTPVFESIIRSALKLEAEQYAKKTTNQKLFIESLERWIYTTINEIENPQKILSFLVSVYGSIKPQGTQKYLIQIKDCGTTYGYLYAAAKQLIIKD